MKYAGEGFGGEPSKLQRTPQTLAEVAYWRFRADILSGTLSPGQALKSDELRQKYELGISPLREALSRLIGERLVVASSQKGFRVAPLTIDDVEDTLRARLLVETAALSKSIDAADVEWETGVLSAFHRLSRQPAPTGPGADAEAWGKHHRDFHRALLAGCGSEWLKNIASMLIDHAERHRRIAIRSLSMNVRKDTIDEHQSLMNAALSGNKVEAISILEHHYRTTAEAVVRTLKGESGLQEPKVASAKIGGARRKVATGKKTV